MLTTLDVIVSYSTFFNWMLVSKFIMGVSWVVPCLWLDFRYYDRKEIPW